MTGYILLGTLAVIIISGSFPPEQRPAVAIIIALVCLLLIGLMNRPAKNRNRKK
jgi:L-asparagine transporter-like permease